MTAGRFIETRRGDWQRLAQLTDKAALRGIKALDARELHELARLYPGVAVDTSRAAMFGIDQASRQRIHQMAIAAHGLLYRRPHKPKLRAVLQFLAGGYPRLIRRLWAYMAVSAGCFLAAALLSYGAVRAMPEAAYTFVPRGLDSQRGDEITAEQVSERYRKMPGMMMSSAITTNNISVAFVAFAMGITACVGTVWVLLSNAMMLGAFVGHFHNHGLLFECMSFLTPHGALEIFAILLAGGAGLRMGLSLAIPGNLKRGASLRAGARDAVLAVLGTIPMFVVAGCVESFVTPSYLDGATKIIIGLGLLALTLAYLTWCGRGKAD